MYRKREIVAGLVFIFISIASLNCTFLETLKIGEADFLDNKSRNLNVPKDVEFLLAYNYAYKYFLENKYNKSQEIIDEILKENPNYLLAKMLKVAIFSNRGKSEEAIKLLEAIKERNDTAEINLKLYELFLKAKDKEAGSILNHMIEKWPNDISIKRTRMEFLFNKSQIKEAKDIANDILSQYLTDSPADISAKYSAEDILEGKELKLRKDIFVDQYNKAYEYFCDGKSTKSLKILDQILKVDPYYLSARLFKVQILALNNKKDEAIELFKSIKKRNDTVEINSQLYSFIVTVGKKEEAESLLKHMIEKWPENISVKQFQMEYLLNKGQNEEAIEIAKDILSHKLTDSLEDVSAQNSAEKIIIQNKLNAVDNYYRESNFKSSLELLNEILALNPNFIPALKLKAIILINFGKTEEAINIRKKLKELDDTVENNLMLSIYLDEYVKKGDEAESILKYALKKWPDDIYVKLNWMQYLFSHSRLSEAQTVAREILSQKWKRVVEKDINVKNSAEEILKKAKMNPSPAPP